MVPRSGPSKTQLAVLKLCEVTENGTLARLEDRRGPSEEPSMSSLSRYKKSGGFLALLSLIETFGPQKKDKFLEMIDQESVVWGRALREKMITFERIFTWPEQVVVEIFKELQPKTLAFVMLGLKPEQKDKIMAYFSHAEKRRLDDILTESKPKPEEIASTLVKVVEQCRKMLKERSLQADKFDPALMVPEDYEAKLEELAAQQPQRSSSSASAGADVIAMMPASSLAEPEPAPALAAAAAAENLQASVDVLQLQKKLQLLAKENKTLKDENTVLKGKLDAIRKIA